MSRRSRTRSLWIIYKSFKISRQSYKYYVYIYIRYSKGTLVSCHLHHLTPVASIAGRAHGLGRSLVHPGHRYPCQSTYHLNILASHPLIHFRIKPVVQANSAGTPFLLRSIFMYIYMCVYVYIHTYVKWMSAGLMHKSLS